MRSRFEHCKADALAMRKRGASLRDVAQRYGVPKSTLNYWFRNLRLTDAQKARLEERNRAGLVTARKSAVLWHNAKKLERLHIARSEASYTLSLLDHRSDAIAELALAILYLGEGSKKSGSTSIGNSDPRILRFFVRTLERLYGVSPREMRCELHLRADQDPDRLIRHWARTLGVPVRNFGKPWLDQRTRGRPSYEHYKGVCVVRCGRVAIQRKLMYIATTFCDTVANDARAVSSLGRASR